MHSFASMLYIPHHRGLSLFTYLYWLSCQISLVFFITLCNTLYTSHNTRDMVLQRTRTLALIQRNISRISTANPKFALSPGTLCQTCIIACRTSHNQPYAGILMTQSSLCMVNSVLLLQMEKTPHLTPSCAMAGIRLTINMA